MDDIKQNGFVSSLDISEHPLISAKKNIRLRYYVALEYLVNSCALDADYARARLLQYRVVFFGEEAAVSLTEASGDDIVKKVVNDFLMPWKSKYRFLLLCDIALIISDKNAVKQACEMIAIHFSRRKRGELYELSEALYDNRIVLPVYVSANSLIKQFRANYTFTTQKEMRVMVTANISAGKSTLINAIIGKPIARMSQEACTANLGFIYNKPFEDNYIHLLGSPLSLIAAKDFANVEKSAVCSIASYFTASGHSQVRICLIDTPGTNFAVNRNHGELTRKAILEECYDKLIYVLNTNRLGSEDEIKHLKYVYENVPEEKVIFVLNKLDKFKSAEDSISESIEGVRADLQKIGYANPIICPISAYFSLLLKMKHNNDEPLDADYQDDFNRLVKKFCKPEYNLSAYYDEFIEDIAHDGDELLKMSFISGMYGFENKLYGGAEYEKSVHQV
jgi:ribosome biogenesis GTPase A